ncbi:MAG: HD domain-containing protein [Lactobacillales bacterium]|nr:HD domain-containing protein [Lactobacillales bacterium]
MKMNKIETFNKEYTYIKNKKYVDNLKIMVDLLPDYFFEVPASSTGKYHPEFSLGDGGLVRHTKFAVRIAHELYSDESVTGTFNQNEKDLMIFALVLHDGLKSGLIKEEYTKVDHPVLVANYIRDNKDKLTLTDNEIEFICNVIESHMGPWNTDYKGNEVLPKPINKYQRFVHMCDFLASRKFLNTKFNNNDIVD